MGDVDAELLAIAGRLGQERAMVRQDLEHRARSVEAARFELHDALRRQASVLARARQLDRQIDLVVAGCGATGQDLPPVPEPADIPAGPQPTAGEPPLPRCPTCGAERVYLTWVAMTPGDFDGWSCTAGHTWAAPPAVVV